MKCIVYLKKMATGEVKAIEWDEGLGWDNSTESQEHVRYLLEEGNWACDCNRADLFAGGYGQGENVGHGHTTYNLQKIVVAETGEEIELFYPERVL